MNFTKPFNTSAKIISALTALMLIFPASISANTEQQLPISLTAEQIKEICRTEGPEVENLMCVFYIRGVLDGLKSYRDTKIHCVPPEIENIQLFERFHSATLQLSVKDLADDVLLKKSATDLSKLPASDFIYWAFTTEIPSENPRSYKCDI